MLGDSIVPSVMLRFFSKRVGRNAQKYKTVEDGRSGSSLHIKPKHILPCKVMLLDETDLSFDIPVPVLLAVKTRHLHGEVGVPISPGNGALWTLSSV